MTADPAERPTRASVLVVAFNNRADLPDCLDALEGTLGPDDELIVYDGGSDDDSAAYATQRQMSGMRVVRSSENRGFAGNSNQAARHARGRLLVFLNADTVVEPGWLEGLLAPLEAGPGLATARIVLLDRPDTINACGNLIHLSGITVCRAYGEPREHHTRSERILAASGGTLAIDRGTFETLGGFDERFFMYLEDTDLSLRAALTGVPCTMAAASVVRHRNPPSFAPRKLFWLERNRYLMLFKVWSFRTFLALLPTLALVEMLVWAYALLRGRDGVSAKVAAWGWLARHAWSIALARKRTQALRRVDDAELLARCDWRLHLRELVAAPSLRAGLELGLTPVLLLCDLWRRTVMASTAPV